MNEEGFWALYRGFFPMWMRMVRKFVNECLLFLSMSLAFSTVLLSVWAVILRVLACTEDMPAPATCYTTSVEQQSGLQCSLRQSLDDCIATTVCLPQSSRWLRSQRQLVTLDGAQQCSTADCSTLFQHMLHG